MAKGEKCPPSQGIPLLEHDDFDATAVVARYGKKQGPADCNRHLATDGALAIPNEVLDILPIGRVRRLGRQDIQPLIAVT